MAVQFSEEAMKQAAASLQRYCAEELEVELSGIQSSMLLAFVLKEIAPTAFNAGVAKSEAFLRDRVADLEGTCHEPEFTYWSTTAAVRRKR